MIREVRLEMNHRNYQKELDQLLEQIIKENQKKTLFLHCCCAPCSSYVRLELYSERALAFALRFLRANSAADGGQARTFRNYFVSPLEISLLYFGYKVGN